MRQATPPDVVKIISKHIPTKVKRVLEPSIGKGALLEPFFSPRFQNLERVVGLDLDQARVAYCKNVLAKNGVAANLYVENFLTWTTKSRFDCVIMNPPFNAKNRDFVSYNNSRHSVEFAFFMKALEHLDDGGVIVAVLPASVISGVSCGVARSEILSILEVKKVYELDSYSFPTIEGTFFILVGKRRRNRKSGVVLEKNFNGRKVSISLSMAQLSSCNYRLDFSYHLACAKLENLLDVSPLNFEHLESLARIDRGQLSAPFLTAGVLHTTSFMRCGWNYPEHFSDDYEGIAARNGDILVKRVSRNSHLSFLIYDGAGSAALSDCVFRIRPNDGVDAFELLFAMRTLYASPLGQRLLLKGTGANYISIEALRKVMVPIELGRRYDSQFQRYKSAICQQNYSDLVHAEKQTYESLGL